MERFPPEEWRVESLRLTSFPTAEPIDTSGWWDLAVGEPAAEVTSKKMSGELTSTGAFAGQQLKLAVTPLRIDWLMSSPDLAQDNLPETIPTIGTLVDALAAFRGLVARWVETAQPRARRLALGVALVHAESGPDEAIQRLQTFLPLSLEPGPVTDFLFQLNRRRTSVALPTLELNRLAKWNRVIFRSVALQVTGSSPTGLISAAQVPFGEAAYFTRAELDINTAQDFSGVLEANQILPLFDELANNAAEIAREGTK